MIIKKRKKWRKKKRANRPDGAVAQPEAVYQPMTRMSISENRSEPFFFSVEDFWVLVTVIEYLIFAGIYLITWMRPANDYQVYSLSILIMFEFIMVHSGTFVTVLKFPYYLLMALVYVPFVWVFNGMLEEGDYAVAWLYVVMILTRLKSVFYRKDKVARTREIAFSGTAAVGYVFLLFIAAILSSKLPHGGLKPIPAGVCGSVNIRAPWMNMCFGVMYYVLLAAVYFFYSRVKGWFEWED